MLPEGNGDPIREEFLLGQVDRLVISPAIYTVMCTNNIILIILKLRPPPWSRGQHV